MINLKEKLLNRSTTIGSWVTIGHTSIVEIMATAGFEWLTIDIEHTVIDYTQVQNLILTIQANNMKALVRVGKNEELTIKRVLDAGADGLIIPMVNDKNNAEQAVAFSKYPPTGKRGVGLARAQKYGTGFEEYVRWVEKECVIIAQIEHISAVDNLIDIIRTPGIDGIVIGPYDLSASMSLPGKYELEEVKNILTRIEMICTNEKKSLGFHVIQPNYKLVEEKIKKGYNFIAFSTDFLFLGSSAREQMHSINLYREKHVR